MGQHTQCRSGSDGGEYKPTPTQCLLNVGPASPVLASIHSTLGLLHAGCTTGTMLSTKAGLMLARRLWHQPSIGWTWHVWPPAHSQTGTHAQTAWAITGKQHAPTSMEGRHINRLHVLHVGFFISLLLCYCVIFAVVIWCILHCLQ